MKIEKWTIHKDSHYGELCYLIKEGKRVLAVTMTPLDSKDCFTADEIRHRVLLMASAPQLLEACRLVKEQVHYADAPEAIDAVSAAIESTEAHGESLICPVYYQITGRGKRVTQ